MYKKLTKKKPIRECMPCDTNSTYLYEGLFKYKDNFLKFRMSAKVHKSPWKMRLIVCCTGKVLDFLSR